MGKTNRNALWYKEIGGDFGAFRYSLGCPWKWYDCLICARADNPDVFSTTRWQGPPSKAIIKAKEKAYKGESKRCHGQEFHRKVYEDKNA